MDVVEGVIGGRIVFEIEITDDDDRAFNTTAFDKFKVCLPKTDGTFLEVSEAINSNLSIMTKVGSAECGVFKIVVTPADSLLLNEGTRQNIDFEMREDADPTNKESLVFENALNMKATSCS